MQQAQNQPLNFNSSELPLQQGTLQKDSFEQEANQIKFQQINQLPQQVSHQARYYYSKVFSSHENPSSFKNSVDISNIENSDFKKNKIQCLQAKEQEHMRILDKLYHSDNTKLLAILSLLKFLSEIKQKNKIEYYSTKTFCAIKSATTEELNSLLTTLQQIYVTVTSSLSEEQSRTVIKEFLIIPRFLISREKIQQFIRDENIQSGFIFLVQKGCLGHENNQANKKMPDKQLIYLLQELLEKPNGKQIFKTICSINHGNKYKIDKGIDAYTTLFKKSLQELRSIDQKNKRMIKKSSQMVSTKSKSTFEIDEQFIPQPHQSKSKLKYANSLNIDYEPPSKGLRIRFTRSMNDNIKQSQQIQQKLTVQIKDQHDKKSQMLLKPFQLLNQKIIQNIILVFPPNK